MKWTYVHNLCECHFCIPKCIMPIDVTDANVSAVSYYKFEQSCREQSFSLGFSLLIRIIFVELFIVFTDEIWSGNMANTQ